jgi:methylphosphotriester-DNA--protein-cysteine methyltransferase
MDMRRVMILKSRTLAQKAVANAGAIEETKRDGAPARRNATLKELEQSLVEILSAAAAAALERAKVASSFRGRKADSYDLARRAINVLHTSASSLHSVGDFCIALDATERQVRRTFNSFFGMGPARLARLHRLNRVRRRLIEGIPESMKIMNVLADCEVTEFGRFAGEYKTLFGEMPSETRRKHLIATPRSTAGASLSLQR